MPRRSATKIPLSHATVALGFLAYVACNATTPWVAGIAVIALALKTDAVHALRRLDSTDDADP